MHDTKLLRTVIMHDIKPLITAHWHLNKIDRIR